MERMTTVFYVGLLPSTALYGLICLGISWAALGLDPIAILNLAKESAGISSIFCWFMLACIPGIFVSYFIVSIAKRVYRRASPEIDWESVHSSFLETLGNDLTNIIRGLKSIKWSFEKMDFDC